MEFWNDVDTVGEADVDPPDSPGPERRLFRAIIAQAWQDLFSTPVAKGFSEINRDQARAFLLDESGKWAASRELICDLAEVNSDTLRRVAVKRVRYI